jgi:hypothetical protein
MAFPVFAGFPRFIMRQRYNRKPRAVKLAHRFERLLDKQ